MTTEEKLLGRLFVDIRAGDFHRAEQAIYGYRLDVEQALQAEVDRLRAQVAAVEAVWMMWRDDEYGSMPWKFVRDMDVVLPEVANRD